MFHQARPDVLLDIHTIDERTGESYQTTVYHFKRKLELLKKQGVEVGDIATAIRKAVDPHYQILITYGVPVDVAEQCIQNRIEIESKVPSIPIPEEVKILESEQAEVKQ